MQYFRRPINRREKTAEIILASLVFLTLAFIYTNSVMPPDASAESSGRVASLIRALLPEGNPLGDFLVTNIRKLAHFFEYAVLGGFLSVYVAIFSLKLKMTVPVSIIFGFTAAFIDETVQIFSGRGPMIADVWIDLFGFCFSALIIHLAFLVYRITKAKACNQ